MDPQLQLDQAHDIWKNILTKEQMMDMGIAKGEGRQNKRPKTTKQTPAKRTHQPQVDNLMKMVAQLALRTETSLNMVLQEHQFLIHMQPGPGSLLPSLLKGTQTWHQSNKELPLRHCLINILWDSLHARLDQLKQAAPQDQLWKECQTLGIINQQGTLPYLRWEASTRTLKPTTEAPLSLEEVIKEVDNIRRLVQDPTTTLRFHSLTKLQDNGDRSLPWLWLISTRNQPETWHCVRKLCYHAIWQQVRIQIKPQSADRSQLAKQIQAALNSGS